MGLEIFDAEGVQRTSFSLRLRENEAELLTKPQPKGCTLYACSGGTGVQSTSFSLRPRENEAGRLTKPQPKGCTLYACNHFFRLK